MQTMNFRRWIAAPAALAAFAAIFSSCAPRQVRTAQPAAPSSAAAETKPTQTEDAAKIPGVEVTEASLRGGEFANVDGLGTIYFDYDSSALKPATLEVLKKNAEYLKGHEDVEAMVAGYCDGRGTIEYNLALGQKRAKEVREYYIRLGVPGKAVATISYGKENPVCSESSEDCWSKNRRAETRVRGRTASATHAPNQIMQ